MARPSTPLVLTREQRSELRRLIRDPRVPTRVGVRARMVLRAAAGQTNVRIATALGTRPATVSKWRQRYARLGASGLWDDFRLGRPPLGDPAELRRAVTLLLEQPPPTGHARWNGRLLAGALGVRADQVWTELRLLGISLQRRRIWAVETVPQFGARQVELAALYLQPPLNAAVLAVSPPGRAPPRSARPGLVHLPGRQAHAQLLEALPERSVPTLGAALAAAPEALDRPAGRTRPGGLLPLLERLAALDPGSQLQVLLDPAKTAAVDAGHPWRTRHPQVRFQTAPSGAAWLQQLGMWFDLLAEPTAPGTAGGSAAPVAAVERFLATPGLRAPFVWLATAALQDLQ